jgi:hypothetical protein
MNPNKSFWEHKDGCWTLASFLIRGLSYSLSDKYISYDEFYFVVDSLNIKNDLSRYWDVSGFYQELGIYELALGKVDRSRDGWRTEQGNIAWSFGNIEGATKYYRESIQHGDSCLSGWGGMFRLALSGGDYKQCAEIFLKLCPPHKFYERRSFIEQTYSNDPEKRWREYDILEKDFAGVSPYFISTCQVMAKAVIFSLLRSGKLGQAETSVVSDFFALSPSQIVELSVSLDNNERELKKINKYILPKFVSGISTQQQVLSRGDTDWARLIRNKILSYQESLEKMIELLRKFFEKGDEAVLEQMFSPDIAFNNVNLDTCLYEAALEFFVDEASSKPNIQLCLFRKFCLLSTYPSFGRSLESPGQWNRYQFSYFQEYLKIIRLLESVPEPIDLIIGMTKTNWYARGDEFNYSLTRGKDAEWSMSILPQFISSSYSPQVLETEETYVDFLRSAYLFLMQKYDEVKKEQRWKNEALLAAAIKSLFGGENVEQHAQPIWLTPQHLDIYLPEYKLAIEYMGKQHYETVDYFGGEHAYNETVKRDRYKKHLCDRMGVNLIYVTYEEDVGLRAREIFSEYNPKK